MNVKTFVFLDLETTGIPNKQNFQTKITELCLVSVQAEHILLGVVPRVQNKLNLCFNPWKLIENKVEVITGLSNDSLENQGSFDVKSYLILFNFLERLEKPICFVAHNGNNFDYPVLKHHLEKINNEFISHIFCIDSFEAFKTLLTKPESHNIRQKEQNTSSSSLDLSDEWDSLLVDEAKRIENILNTSNGSNISEIQRINETTPAKKITKVAQNNLKIKKARPKNEITNYLTKPAAKKKLNFDNSVSTFKLSSLYERLIQKKAENVHFAEGDVKMMLECAVHLGERFVNFANQNAKLFTDISKMQPKVIKS